MNKPQIRILSSLARAGGTLVSKCLVAMDGIVLLSEIHPQATHMFNPVSQAQDWYQLFRPGELPDSLPFIKVIHRIASRCEQHDICLILRDWAHLDFVGQPFLKNPAYRLLLTEALAPVFDILQFALVRHPIDQWISTSSLKVMQGQLDLDKFLAGYRRFAEQSVKTGFMRFEDFTQEPSHQMQRLCKNLEINFDPGFLDRWQANTWVTGDISKTSRGAHMNGIMPLAQHVVGDALMTKLRNNADYHLAIDLLGYTDPPTGE